MTTASECCADGSCCAPAGHSRRTFLAMGLAGAGMLAAPANAVAELGLDPGGLGVVPAGKNLAPLSSLTSRGKPTEYSGAALQKIGMPAGGGCTGQVYLAGDGKLWAWDILNPSAFPLGGATGDGPHYARPLTASQPFAQSFSLRVNGVVRNLDATGFTDVRFVGQYPVGTVTYRAADCPVVVTASTFSPFVPLNTLDSTIPATTVAFTLVNTTRKPVAVEVIGASANPVCLTSRSQQPTELLATPFDAPGLHGVEFAARAGERPDTTDILFEDWESGTFDGWTVEGDAFGAGPVTAAEVPGYMRRFGDLLLSGRNFVTSHNYRAGGAADDYTGALTSREFTIERSHIAVSVGGGRKPGAAGVEVLVGDQVVASATGYDAEPCVVRTLDVTAHSGQTARIRIADRATGAWAHVNVDAIVFTDHPEIVFEDWSSGTYDAWTVDGDAFGDRPVTPAETPPDFRRPFGEINDLNVVGTHFATSYNFRAGGNADAYQGKLTSAPFEVTRGYVTAWVGGGGHAGQTCVNVVVDGNVVATATGREIEPLTATSMDVSAHLGATAHLEVVDAIAAGWGHVNVGRIVFSDRPARSLPIEQLPEFGTFSLAATDNAASVATNGGDSATVTVPVTVPPGQSRAVQFVLGWHFPTPQPTAFGFLVDGPRLRHHYVTRFASARAVVEHVAADLPNLAAATNTWVTTWYADSTLPHWFLERTLSSASTLATNTCFRFDNGRFYAWEGIYCCAGTCGHVWNYAQSVARLFPDLERDTRERVDLGLALKADGQIGNRGELEAYFADGQCGTILRVYREHQMSPDMSFLQRVWPQVTRAIEWLISQDRAGGDTPNGILEGSQWNTLDAQWWGEIPWISGLYVAALHAGAAMAREMGDVDAAARYTQIARRGTEYLETRLWSDEYQYFFQKVDPDHANAPNSNRGCHIDQLYGQTYAAQLGLPRVFSRDKARRALKSVFRNNFVPDASNYRPPGIPNPRVYATSGEAGTLMCTWPFGGSEGAGLGGVVGYFSEVWTGQEYQLAAHLVSEGMVTEGLSVVKAVHDRYHAAKRNPYNEIECSDHYVRAMMSFGVYLALLGYEHHGPRAHLGFAPKITPDNFAAAFTTATGWGLYRQRRGPGRQTCDIGVRWGQVVVRTLAFESERRVRAVTVAGRSAPFQVTDRRVVITLPAPVTVPTGATLSVVLHG